MSKLKRYKDKYLTINTDVRWEWLSSLVAGATMLSFLAIILLHSLGMATLSIPQPWLSIYIGLIVTTTTWLYGDKFFGAGNSGE